MFGGVNVAIPFMLDLLRIPADTFQLFVVVSQVAVVRFESLLSAMYTITLALLGANAVAGLIEIRWRRLLRYLVITAASLLAVMGAIYLALNFGLKQDYQQYRIFIRMELLKQPAPSKVYESAPPPPEVPVPGQNRLDRIFERGTVRVGFLRDALPFAFHNESGHLVGLDVEMANQLARDMDVGLELVLVKGNEAVEMLNAGQIDIMMSGIPIAVSRAREVAFSHSYMEQTLAFIVEDHKREAFSNWDLVQKMTPLRLGMINLPYYVGRVRRVLPQAEIEILDTPREFFTSKQGKLDAFLYWAEAGSAWSLIYPDYSVAVPHPRLVSTPLAYPMPREAHDLVRYVNSWIELKKSDKTLEDLYNYWILGKEAKKRAPRWSVLRNVLHWVD